MRILYIHHNSHTGGASNSLKYLLESLKSKNIEIHIISPGGKVFNNFLNITNKVYEIKGIPLFQATCGTNFPLIRSLISLRHLSQYKIITDIVKKVNPDIVHLNEIGQFFLAKRLKKLGFKVVLHSRVAINRSYKILTYFTEKIINKYIDYVFAIDGSVVKSIYNVKNIKIVYNPIKPSTKKIKIPKKKNKIKCLFLANLLKQKGVINIIKSAIRLKNNKNIVFYIAGSNVRSNSFYNSFLGHFLDFTGIYPDYQKLIINTIKQNNLTNLKFLGQVENIEYIFKDIHILLLPTLMNEPSRSVFEAGYHGIPSIISLKDVVEDVVEHNYNGIIIKENDFKNMCESILYLSQNENLRLKLGNNSSKRFNKLNNHKRSARLVYSVYKKLLN